MPIYTLLTRDLSYQAETTQKIDSLPIISYVFDVLVIMIMMCMLVYLSFSIVKKSQANEKFESLEDEAKKIMQKFNIKNQIEIIQNGIVKLDDSYILPVRKCQNDHIFDESVPKIKHLNSLKDDEYDDLLVSSEFIEELESSSNSNNTDNTDNTDFLTTEPEIALSDNGDLETNDIEPVNETDLEQKNDQNQLNNDIDSSNDEQVKLEKVENLSNENNLDNNDINN